MSGEPDSIDAPARQHARWDDTAGHIRALAALMLPGQDMPSDVLDNLSCNELGLALEALSWHVNQPPKGDGTSVSDAVVRIYVAHDALPLDIERLVRGTDESEQEYADRKRTLGSLFSAPASTGLAISDRMSAVDASTGDTSPAVQAACLLRAALPHLRQADLLSEREDYEHCGPQGERLATAATRNALSEVLCAIRLLERPRPMAAGHDTAPVQTTEAGVDDPGGLAVAEPLDSETSRRPDQARQAFAARRPDGEQELTGS
jgi:hypothetical protein